MSNTLAPQKLLRITYGLVPIVAGLDKFTNLLTNWSSYLDDRLRSLMDPSLFMKLVGIVEIIAGILVLVRPIVGGTIVALWLVAIAGQLILGGHYYDVAVRDLVMAVGAYTLVQLSRKSATA